MLKSESIHIGVISFLEGHSLITVLCSGGIYVCAHVIKFTSLEVLVLYEFWLYEKVALTKYLYHAGFLRITAIMQFLAKFAIQMALDLALAKCFWKVLKVRSRQ